jgi:chromate transport protein ChrA
MVEAIFVALIGAAAGVVFERLFRMGERAWRQPSR